TGVSTRIVVYDVTGKLLGEMTAALGGDGYIRLDLTAYPKGVLTVVVESNEGAWAQKVILH
ncbi:MAG: hypothetical protein ACKO1U_08720, partial [Bacteroidota bacterium]